MGSDKHIGQDHCYLEVNGKKIKMNVEEATDGSEYPESSTIIDDKSHLSDLKNVMMEDCIIIKVGEDDGLVQNNYNQVIDYCADHSDLLLLEDENLVKPGDKFQSHDEFVQYLNKNAKRWFFYYKCSDSRKPNTDNEIYTYNCVYLKNKDKYKKKGIRKRNNNLKTNCPCRIRLRHLPNEKQLTVVSVCNHHDHTLSEDEFHKLQHGRRLPPYVKEEIMDFLALQVDVGKIRKYVQMQTGFDMSRPFFYAIDRMMNAKNIERQITDERLKELSDKIKAVDDIIDFNEEENTNDIPAQYKKRTMSPKDENGKKKRLSSPGQSRRDGHNKKSIEQSIKCETQRNPWISDQCVPVLPNRKLVMKSEPNETLNDSTDTITYTQYIDGNYIVTESIEGEGANTEDAQTYIAYETVVDNNETIENSEIDSSQIKYSESEEYNSTYHDTTGMNETVEYIDGEAVEYITDFNETDGSGCDVAVQTSQNKGHSFVPVFDVYMKDGNVTGFVVNEEYIKSAGVEKAVQTNGDCLASDIQSQADSATAGQDQSGEMNEMGDTSETVLQDVEISYQSSDTYTKHEYIHKYNIDRYMTQPNFPKYIQTLAKQTYTDVLQMFTNVYKEKAIFKMTTTQKGKEGNTKIWYLLNARRIRRNNPTDEERGTKERLGSNLKDIFVLREKVKALKRQNKELITRNKYLEDVALGVSKM